MTTEEEEYAENADLCHQCGRPWNNYDIDLAVQAERARAAKLVEALEGVLAWADKVMRPDMPAGRVLAVCAEYDKARQALAEWKGGE